MKTMTMIEFVTVVITGDIGYRDRYRWQVHSVPADAASLEFSYIGYQRATVTITDNVINLQLMPDINLMEELACGYWIWNTEKDRPSRFRLHHQ